MYIPPKNDLAYSQWRLNSIMSQKRLIFNPYCVSDQRLMEIVRTTGWGCLMDITELTSVHFTRLRAVNDYRRHDGIYMLVANDPTEIFIPFGTLKNPITANDTIQPERTWVGKRPIRNVDDIERLVGKTYFVSRIIRGCNIRGFGAAAYRMHRLTGKTDKDASVVRKAIIEAKIEMLERMLKNPQSPDFLSCSKGLFDYESRIRKAIQVISHFPDTLPPAAP